MSNELEKLKEEIYKLPIAEDRMRDLTKLIDRAFEAGRAEGRKSVVEYVRSQSLNVEGEVVHKLELEELLKEASQANS